MLTIWTTVKSEIAFKTKWFQIYKDRCQTSDGLIIPEYYTWKKRDCVIVFPVTVDDDILLVRQYRHGVQQICLDYPGGTVNEGQSVLDAAFYELVEETGYAARTLQTVGCYAMDSSYSNQMAHFVIATGCKRVTEPFEPQEKTEIITVPACQLYKLAQSDIDCLLCSLLTIKGLTHVFKRG